MVMRLAVVFWLHWGIAARALLCEEKRTYGGEEAGVGGAGGARSGGGDAVHGGGCDCDCGFVCLVGLMRLI